MSLPSPIEMPSPLPVNSKVFDLSFNQDITPAGQGFIQVIDRVTPFWMAKFQTPGLTDARDQAFQSFLDQLNGSSNPFLGYDPRRPRLWAYRNVGGSPWIADVGNPPRVASASYTGGTLGVDRFTVGTVFTAGDYIAYQRGNAWYLHRLVTGVTVGGGGTATLAVVPRPLLSSTPVVCRVVKACCAMKIIGGVQKDDSVDSFPKYAFSAAQFIDRSS